MVALHERTQSSDCMIVAAGKKTADDVMRNAERNAQWRHTLQSGIETARVPLDELTPHAGKTRAVTGPWHLKKA